MPSLRNIQISGFCKDPILPEINFGSIPSLETLKLYGHMQIGKFGGDLANLKSLYATQAEFSLTDQFIAPALEDVSIFVAPSLNLSQKYPRLKRVTIYNPYISMNPLKDNPVKNFSARWVEDWSFLNGVKLDQLTLIFNCLIPTNYSYDGYSDWVEYKACASEGQTQRALFLNFKGIVQVLSVLRDSDNGNTTVAIARTEIDPQLQIGRIVYQSYFGTGSLLKIRDNPSVQNIDYQQKLILENLVGLKTLEFNPFAQSEFRNLPALNDLYIKTVSTKLALADFSPDSFSAQAPHLRAIHFCGTKLEVSNEVWEQLLKLQKDGIEIDSQFCK
jgi:hypothetical protein